MTTLEAPGRAHVICALTFDDYLHLLEYGRDAGAIAVAQSKSTGVCSVCDRKVRVVSLKIPTLYNPRFQWRDLVPEIHRRECFAEHKRRREVHRASRRAELGDVDLWG